MGLPRSKLVKSKLPATAADSALPAPLALVPAMPEPVVAGAPPDPAADGPSARSLLERAARLGPPRPTLESIPLPRDPILGAKMLPEIVARRAKLALITKATVGACLLLCLAALGDVLLEGGTNVASAATTSPLRGRAFVAPSVEALAPLVLEKGAHRIQAVNAKVVKAHKRR